MNLLDSLEWKVGDQCYAIFSEDELWYPAVIVKEIMILQRYNYYINNYKKYCKYIIKFEKVNTRNLVSN